MTQPPIVPGHAPAPHGELSWMPTPQPPPRRRHALRWVLLGSVLGLVLLAAGAVLAFTLPGSPLKPSSALRDANTACGSKGELSDGDHTLFLDMWGQKPNNGLMSPDDVACTLRALNTPTYVTTHMDQTRALDGRQTDSWANFEASWTYHPDNGLDVLIREK